MKFSLFTTFFIAASNERQQELLLCLKKNTENDYIKNIFLLLDGKNESQIKEIVGKSTDVSKIQFINVNRVPTYGDWIYYSKQKAEELADISVFCNADVYTDDTIIKLSDYTAKNETIVCLSRHDLKENTFEPHPNPHWSQDLWAISKDNILKIGNQCFIDELTITHTGMYRCDNKLAYIFAMRGWEIYNPCLEVKCYHLQKDVTRNYGKFDTDIVGGLCFVSATNSPDKPSELDISVMPVKIGKITKCAINKYLQKNLFPENVSPAVTKSNLTLAFYGASVTKQKTGYVHYIEKMCNHNILQFGHGGMHLKDAGILFADEVCKSKPTFCFVEWFTPGIKNYTKESMFLYLDVIVLNLLKANCVPVFLFLRGVTSTDLFEDKLASYKMIISEYCIPKNIPFIEVYKNVDVGCKLDEEILRDTVHTNDLGSELYAKAILDYFNSYILNTANIKNITTPNPNKYSNIKTLEFEQKCTTGLLIKGSAELVGIYQDVGPFSCFCDVYVDGKLVHKDRSIIDIHCDYIRPTINFNYTFKESLLIEISTKDVDYDDVVKRKINWERYNKEGIFAQQKELRLHSLHYVGEITEVTLL
jgi:hypothetical protein